MDQERAWIEQALQGDQTAFGHLVRAYERPVYNLTYRMLGNAAEAEDAAQETFLRAYSKLATYQPERKFVNWLLSIASHHCIDRLRRRSRAPQLSLDGPLPPQWTVSNTPRPDQVVSQNQQREQVLQVLASLLVRPVLPGDRDGDEHDRKRDQIKATPGTPHDGPRVAGGLNDRGEDNGSIG
jgi:RNA polymerase sigma-70 factor (ECF subfamily)